MTYPDYSLPVIETARILQGEFEALNFAAGSVPKAERDTLDKWAKQLFAMRVGMRVWADEQQVD